MDSILDELAVETKDTELIDLMEANVAEYRANVAEKKPVEKRRKKGINWVKQKGMRFGKDMSGKQYAIIEEGKGRQTLYVDNQVMGTFGSIKEAEAAVEVTDNPYTPEGNKAEGYRVLVNGKPLNTRAKLTKRAAVDVLSRLHARFGEKLPVAKMVTALNKMSVEEMSQLEKRLNRQDKVEFVEMEDIDNYLDDMFGEEAEFFDPDL